MMPVRFTQIKRLTATAWEYRFEGADLYYGVIDGQEVFSNLEEPRFIAEWEALGAGASFPAYAPPLEILDQQDHEAGVKTLSEQFPPYVIFQWRGDRAASYYRVEKFIDGDWQLHLSIPENANGYYSASTGLLESGSSQKWRIVAVREEGEDLEITAAGHPMEWTHITAPRPPVFQIELDGTDIEVTAP